MERSYLRLLTLAIAGSGLAPLLTSVVSRYRRDQAFPWPDLPLYLVLVLGVGAATLAVASLFARLRGRIARASAEQAAFLREGLPDRWISLAIVAAAALSLFLELAMIRWQATVFPFFAFYKNLSLLSCFAGLGLGYALGKRDGVPLVLTLPVLGWQFLLMIGMRYGMTEAQFQSLNVLPFREQLNMGLPQTAHLYSGLPVYFVLAVVFVLTALAFIPIGQLCGRLMERRETLTAYGLNLLGSLAGVLLMFVVSAFWTPPTVWFLVAAAVLLGFLARSRPVLLWGAASAVVALLVVEWPVSPNLQRIYSPYQLLEVGRDDGGLMEIRAAGHYYQRVWDFSGGADPAPADSAARRARDYYDLPYTILDRPSDVAVVGAGTGNDVAAALRAGAGRVDAIEIDPAILMLGRDGHPEHPYDSDRVHAVVDDARSFLRTTDRTYDLIVFGLLDSHTLLSQASSVRLDSFVYTLEAMREARARLKPHGMIALAFSVLNHRLGRKIYLMLEQAFDGHPPLCVQAGYDGGVVFLETADHRLELPPGFVERRGFIDRSAAYGSRALRADVSTDDWPFFYMPSRVYPVSYLVMVGLVLALSLGLIRTVLRERARAGGVPFFLLGAGFMLVETKGITELGLTFGNSWQVIGVVIAGIMVMAFLANAVVHRFAIARSRVPYGLLLASLALGWWVAGAGGLPSTPTGRIGTALLLTLPLFFSGIVFSTLLRARGEIAGAMAANLFGAMCGGLLEYNAMYFGFRFLYLMAAGLYVLAFAWGIFALRLGGAAPRAGRVAGAVVGG
jgi:hypothetical protein